MFRSDERGMAIVIAMFMTLVVSALAASMAYMARTETVSSQSYTTMAQARYAAESGLAAAANYLLSAEYTAVAPGSAGDPLPNYNTGVSPVERGGAEVRLSTVPNASNYPVSGVVTAFGTAASGTLTVSNGLVAYGARARLLAMRPLTDTMSGGTRTLQTWEITGVGRRGGTGSAEVEVTAIIDRQTVAAFRYAAFAKHPGCNALSFEGGATTQSYNSTAALVGGNPVTANSGGNVGTNGNLNVQGTNTQIHGTLSTPRAGVGSCTENNVTALTIQGKAEVHGGLIELPQAVEFPTPPAPVPAPPTNYINFTKTSGCAGALLCASSGGVTTITPDPNVPYLLGNVVLDGQAEVVLRAGTYHVNSLTVSGNNTQIKVVPGDGPVIIKIAGTNVAPATPVLSLAGNSLSNPTFDPARLQFIYGGTGNVYISGGTQTAALVYAPDANVTLAGNSDFYGSVVGGKMTIPGSARVLYDTNLSTSAQTAGNPVMSTFTWQAF